MDIFDFDHFDNPPSPPHFLYKYLSAERIGNVIDGGTLRFTPLMNTNDSFEVRSTFHKIAGPNFLKMLKSQMDDLWSRDFAKSLIEKSLKENNLSFVSPDAVLDLLDAKYGGDFLTEFRAEMGAYMESDVAPVLNTSERAWEIVENFSRKFFCFSLSERMDSAPMWAHYADNNQGFIVAFDTRHEWFQNPKDCQKTRLRKVTYFDGKLEEPFEDLNAALISKTTDWAYEREWRLYLQKDQINTVIGDHSDPIHLVEFPSEAVDRVILGCKASEVTRNQIQAILSVKYPKARLVRAVPNRQDHSYGEISED